MNFLRWIVQICAITLMACAFYGCCEDDPINPPTPPVEETIPAGEDGSVEFEISNENGGDSGESTTNPAVATTSEPLEMTISQSSSYTDPDGTVYECEPKAEIVVKANVDTVFVKDIKSLTIVSDDAEVNTSKEGSNPVTHTTKQTFDVGGQKIEFDLAYEVYTYVNSKKQNVEMPYIKLNNANFGSAESVDVRSANAVRLSNISIRPLKPVTRSIEVTDTTEYEVTARFNLDAETANLATTTKKTISFEVVYVGVVTETNTYPGAEHSYSLTDSNGNVVEDASFTVEPNSTFELNIKQSSSYTDQNGAVTSTPTAWTKITTPDTLRIDNADELAGMLDKVVIETSSDELEGNLPYYKLEGVVLDGEVSVAEVSRSEDGKLEVYKATATYKQKAVPVNIEDGKELEFTYVVEYLGKVAFSGAEHSYSLTDASGNALESTSFTVEPNSTFELNIKQSSSYTDRDGNVETKSPTAWTKITTPDTLRIDNADELAGMLDKVVIETSSDELEGNLPYYKLEGVVLDGEVSVAEVSRSEDGKTQVYKATATYKQKAVPVNIEGGKELEFTYVVEYLGKVSIRLVDVKYEQEVIWEDAHDNIYTNSQVVVTRKATYSDGTVDETKFYSTKNFVQAAIGRDPKDSSGEIEYVDYSRNETINTFITTCATGVPDLEHFSYDICIGDNEFVNWNDYQADSLYIELFDYEGPVGVWTEYKHQETDELYSATEQVEGWYGKQFGYLSRITGEYIGDSYHPLRQYNLSLIYKDRFFCIDGQLFTCDPLEHTHKWSVETIETPNRGTCSLHKLEADVTWFGRKFYYAVVDTVYVKQ